MRDIAVFLCCLTPNMALPWAEAGVECYCIDTQHLIRKPRRVRYGAGAINFVWGDVRSWRPPEDTRTIFAAAFTPCTDVAGSGSRDWPTKGGYLLRDALEMFEAARQAMAWSGAPYMLENSVGKLSSIEHIGKPAYYFDPCDYTGWCPEDNYTKKTCIWPGNGFIMPPALRDLTLGPPDDRIHKASPGDDRADFRSVTPMGFSRATFHSNYKLGGIFA